MRRRRRVPAETKRGLFSKATSATSYGGARRRTGGVASKTAGPPSRFIPRGTQHVGMRTGTGATWRTCVSAAGRPRRGSADSLANIGLLCVVTTQILHMWLIYGDGCVVSSSTLLNQFSVL